MIDVTAHKSELHAIVDGVAALDMVASITASGWDAVITQGARYPVPHTIHLTATQGLVGGDVDGRALEPLSADLKTSAATVHFADGTSLEEGFAPKAVIDTLTALASSSSSCVDAQGLSVLSTPPIPQSPQSGPDCALCHSGCTATALGIAGGGVLVCGALFDSIFFGIPFALCELGVIIAAAVVDGTCQNGCESVGGECCPYACNTENDNNFCCFFGETCVDQVNHLCCPALTTGCGTTNCCANGGTAGFEKCTDVYISLANPAGSGANFVAAAVSSNGGQSWDTTSIVNDVGCGNGIQDQPYGIFDYTTNPATLWVTFRHSGIGNPSVSGGCIRRGIVEKNPAGLASIRWLDDDRTIDGMGGAYQDGIAVVAGDGVVTVMYAAATTFLPGCSCCPDNGGLFSMDFGTVDSFDNGHTWVDNAKLFHTSTYQWCVVGQGTPPPGSPGNGLIMTGLRSFGIVRTPGGMEYAVLQDSRTTARLFMSAAAGIKGDQNQFSTIRTWYEWCPGTPTSDAGGGPTWNWKPTSSAPDVGDQDQPPCSVPAINSDPSNLGLDLVWPTIASDGRGNILISDIEQQTNDPASPPTINYAVRGITNPQQATAILQGPTFMLLTAIQPPTKTFTRPMGDYGWIAVRPQGSKFRAPGCTTTNDFYSLWTGTDGTGNANILVRGFSLTPP